MLLAIDVGNTNIVLGIFKDSRLIASWRIATLRERTSDELGILSTDLLEHGQIDHRRIRGVILASVVPPLTPTIIVMCERYFGLKPMVVDGEVKTGMRVMYEPPADVGADRVVNGVAAYEKYGRPSARPVIVVDFGTATTFDAISADGDYLGGVIAPGVQISADALFQRAARLPRVDVHKPPSVIGRTTVTSMQSGLFFGYVGLIEGVVTRMRHELGEGAAVVATGGLADMIASETPVIEVVDRELTLNGLRIIWERNQWGL